MMSGSVALYPKAKGFTQEESRWRRCILKRIASNPVDFGLDTTSIRRSSVRDAFDEDLATLKIVARVLELVYGSPRHGNKDHPIDELVYIILSRKTRESAYVEAFEALRDRFPTWDDLLAAPTEEIDAAVYSSGLVGKKTYSIISALRIIQDTFGELSLACTTEWPEERLEEFLCSLPEIGPKSARCVMMCSLGRPVFPVDTHVARIFKRMGLFSTLGIDLRGSDHKYAQRILKDLVPPELRYSLHVNMVAHGRAICKSRGPRCEDCEVRKFCRQYRGDQAACARKSNSPTVVDLFCGPGGLSEGFRWAGFRTILGVDSDEAACRTFRLNHPEVPTDMVVNEQLDAIDIQSLADLIGETRVDVVVGGPPCQGFSKVRRHAFKKDANGDRPLDSEGRNELYRCMVEAVRLLQPLYVVVENVVGIHTAMKDRRSYLRLIQDELEATGYTVDCFLINSAIFGVPQNRVRYFLIGRRAGLPAAIPTGTHRDPLRRSFRNGALRTPLWTEEGNDPVTLWEVIGDLPELSAGDGDWISTSDERSSAMIDREKILYNHVARYQNERDLELFELLEPGEDGRDIVEKYQRPDLMIYRDDVFHDKYFRLRPDEPCRTIVAHLCKDGNSFIHPTQIRSISVREAAAIQSFPDDHIFTGSRGDQFRQVGNAVPPLVAEGIACAIMRSLESGVQGKAVR